MAIAIDTSQQVLNGGNGQSAWNISHANAGDYMLVWVVADRANTSVSYNSVALTKIGTLSLTFVTFTFECWRLKAPSVGTFNVTITPSGGAPQTMRAIVKTYSGVDQTTSEGTVVVTTQDTQAAAGVTTSGIVSAVGEVVSEGAMTYNKTATAGASQTSEGNSGAAIPTLMGSRKAGAASVTVSWTWSGNQIAGQIAVPIKPATGAATQQPTKFSYQPFLAQ